MTLSKPHKDWKLDVLPVPDTRWIGSDELLTQLWLRVAYDNGRTTRKEGTRSLVAELASLLEEDSDHFEGFAPGTGVAETWLRADLLKALKRKPDQFIVARPVHLPATRLRNTKKDSDANGSAILYAWLAEHSPDVVEDLKSWIDVVDPSFNDLGDLPAYALALLATDEARDIPVPGVRSPLAQMICSTRGRLFVEDLRGMLAYRGAFPRAVLIDHIRRLSTLHLALHLIQTYASVVEISADPDAKCGCRGNEVRCAWMPELIADCGEDPKSDVAKLAEHSWVGIEESLAAYVRSHLRLRKLMEFADSSADRRKKFECDSLRGLARIEGQASRGQLAEWARARIGSIDAPDTRELAQQYEALGLDSFSIYMSLLYAHGEKRWFNYHRQVLDSVFGKNFRDGAMRQPLGGRRRRRVALSPPMLETLVLAAMVDFDPSGAAITRSLRVDQLTDRLAERYGLLIARPPLPDEEDPFVTKTMIQNHATFRSRLRQAGLFVDQSDAFLAQTIRPRVRFG